MRAFSTITTISNYTIWKSESGMDIDLETIYLVLKIAGVILSAILLYRFRRDIVKVVTDILVGGDTKEYVGKDVAEIKKRIEERMDGVLR